MFNELKSTQAAAHLMKRANGTMNYMVLIKFLYVSDRESLLGRGRPITWDSFVSMKYGPVLSRVHDLITEMPEPDEPNIWKSFISEPCAYAVSLVGDPGEDELSEAEIEILDNVFENYRRFLNDPFGFARFLHASFPEVIEVEKGQAFPLAVKDVVAKNKTSEEEAKAILREIKSIEADHSIFVSRW